MRKRRKKKWRRKRKYMRKRKWMRKRRKKWMRRKRKKEKKKKTRELNSTYFKANIFNPQPLGHPPPTPLHRWLPLPRQRV